MSPVPIRISAVVVGDRPGIDTAACIRALLGGSVPPQEVVLVAPKDAMGEGTQGQVQAVLKRELVHQGASWAERCGLGLEHATGELVAVLDAACQVAPDWMELLVSFLDAHPDTAAVEGRRSWRDGDRSPAGHVEVDVHSLAWRVEAGSGDRAREVACLAPAAFVVRRSALAQLGAAPLDRRFQTGMAANDLFARLIERRWRLYHLPRAEIRCADTGMLIGAIGVQAVPPRERVLFASKHLSDERRAQQIDLVSNAAHPGLRALFAPPTPSMLEAQATLAWLREHKRELAAEREHARSADATFEAAVEAAQGRGGYSFHARQDVLGLIPASAKVVVDVGCASGVLGAALKRQRPGIQVRGVEISSEAASRAREVLDDVYCGSAEDSLPSSWPRPDCVVFADVLEHLPDPWSALRRYRELLGPGGAVVVSVPNIGHRSVVDGILHGKFEYVDAGILDRTHLRFFTRASAVALVEAAGFKVERVHCNVDSPTQPRWLRVANRLGVLKTFFQDCQVIQFVILASRES